jgi:hypothetical protein
MLESMHGEEMKGVLEMRFILNETIQVVVGFNYMKVYKYIGSSKNPSSSFSLARGNHVGGRFSSSG